MRKRRMLAAVTVTAALTGALTTPALAAATPSPLEKAKAETARDLDTAVFWNVVQQYVTVKDATVPAADSRALVTGLESNRTALQDLRVGDGAAKTVAAVQVVRSKYAALQTFEYVLPRVVAVRTSDNLLAADAKLGVVASSLKVQIAKAAKRPDITVAEAALASYQRHVLASVVLANRAHSAIVLGGPTAANEAALAGRQLDVFGSTLNVLAAIADYRANEAIVGRAR